MVNAIDVLERQRVHVVPNANRHKIAKTTCNRRPHLPELIKLIFLQLVIDFEKSVVISAGALSNNTLSHAQE